MIHSVKLENVGVAPYMDLDFLPRLNLITGDNGLGKSFLLDVVWWILSRKWPAQLNSHLSSGAMARPLVAQKAAKITFTLDGKRHSTKTYTSTYDRRDQAWEGRQGRPLNPGLVLYAMSDGSFAVWDPARNYWKTRGNADIQEKVPAYVFSANEIMYGLSKPNEYPKEVWLCNGLLRDVETWRLKHNLAWQQFTEVLKKLSPDGEEMRIGEAKKVGADEELYVPTLETPYAPAVPVIYASAAIRRILSLAYCLVWAWQSHVSASEEIGQEPEKHIIFLIDEIEAHLHPRWQRTIARALVDVVNSLTNQAETQVILTTHSPLVMAGCEDFFTSEKDQWLDLDLVDRRVQITSRDFEKIGTADQWLTSDAFDLKSTRSPGAEQLLNEAAELLKVQPSRQELEDMDTRLSLILHPMDRDLFLWRYQKEKKEAEI